MSSVAWTAPERFGLRLPPSAQDAWWARSGTMVAAPRSMFAAPTARRSRSSSTIDYASARSSMKIRPTSSDCFRARPWRPVRLRRRRSLAVAQYREQRIAPSASVSEHYVDAVLAHQLTRTGAERVQLASRKPEAA